jgi:HSP20 family protein
MADQDDPFEALAEVFRGQADDLMESLLHRRRPAMARDHFWKPAVDIYESPQALIVLVEIPGMRREAIEVTLRDNILRIAGHRHGAMPEGARTCHQMEIACGPFERRLRIGAPIDTRRITAEYQNGFLRITLPKATPRTTDRVEILSG